MLVINLFSGLAPTIKEQAPLVHFKEPTLQTSLFAIAILLLCNKLAFTSLHEIFTIVPLQEVTCVRQIFCYLPIYFEVWGNLFGWTHVVSITFAFVGLTVSGRSGMFTLFLQLSKSAARLTPTCTFQSDHFHTCLLCLEVCGFSVKVGYIL